MQFYNKLWKHYKTYLMYGVSLALLLALLKYVEYQFAILDQSYEWYIGIIAIVFTLLGLWLHRKLSKPQVEKIYIEKEIYITQRTIDYSNASIIDAMNLSKRELEILELLSKGYSNQEIAAALFISLSTVKVHNQHLYEKLAVKRRTQAVEKAQSLGILS